eukprot:84109_1
MALDRYDCGFHICPNDSLQILVKDRKSNRTFSNLFTKSKLESMNITFPTSELPIILETARDAKKNNLKNWKFLIKYKSIPSSLSADDCGPLTPQNTLFSYKSGDKMVLLLHVNEPRFWMKATFKLNEMITNCPAKLSLSLSQSVSLHANDDRGAFTPTAQQLQRSPRRSLRIPRARSQSSTCTLTKPRALRKSRQLFVGIPDPVSVPSTKQSFSLKRKLIKPLKGPEECVSSEGAHKIVELEAVIESFKAKNGTLLSKIQNMKSIGKIQHKSPSPKRLKRESENKENKLWLKHKIERLEKNLDGKMMKQFGIQFKSHNEWKEIVNQSFNILVKLSKSLHSKDEQYQSVSNKWMKAKKENKELSKSDSIKDAQLEKQRNIIRDLKQQIVDRDASLNAKKQNERQLEDTIKQMEKEFATKTNEFDEQINSMNEEKVRLNVLLNNSIQEMKENKTDFDELQQDNDTMHEEIRNLKFSIYQSNQKSRELIECIKNSQDICDRISLGHISSAAVEISTADSDGEGDVQHSKATSNGFFAAAHNDNNYV